MAKEERKYELFCEAIEQLDKATALINEYDALLHNYGGTLMYQAESQMIKAIGDNPGITAAELTEYFEKTASACSQLIRKLKAKGWAVQRRNESNCREYNLFLTPEGEKIYSAHKTFEETCYRRAFEMLEGISEGDLQAYIRIQEHLNEAFALDVKESKEIGGNENEV